MKTIKVKCKKCKTETEVNWTCEIPKDTNYISVTVCPECNDSDQQLTEYSENYVKFRKKRVTKVKNPKLF